MSLGKACPSRGAVLSAGASLLAAALGLCAAGCGGRPPAYDNLVFVTIDTLRADHLGLYGYPRPTSPFLDQLGREGVVFWQAVAASSHTAPSHATMLTSLYPEQHQVLVNGNELRPDVPGLAALARDQGIETAAFVSVRFLEKLRTGFDAMDADVPEGEVFRTADATVSRAVDWLRGRDRARRFVLWVHVYDPHQHVASTRMPEPHYARMREDAARRGDELLHFLRQEQGYPREWVGESIDRYDAQIAFVDEELRRLFAAVSESAPGGRTLRVVTADHGEGLGNHGHEGHGRNLYNEQLRTPLIVHGDRGRLRPAVVTRLVRHVDLLPTLGELLGLGIADGLRLEGRSLVPLLEARTADLAVEPAFAQRRPADRRRLRAGWDPGVKLAAQDGGHKYVYRSEGGDEFYDLRHDPYELRNLIGTEHPEKQRLREWLLGKYQALVEDRRTEAAAPDVDPRLLEDLEALGYI